MAKYLQMTVSAPAEEEEILTMQLLEAGALGVAVDDPALIKQNLLSGKWDASVFDGQEIVTGRLTLTATFTEDAEALLRELILLLSVRSDILAELTELPDIDWQQKWKESFEIQQVGENIAICPYWLTAQMDENRTNIIIEPGMAFGTGDHATTSMVLEMIEKYLQPGMNLLDLGCGSGILAIAGLLFGAESAFGIDIDPVCAAAVENHCELNQISPEKMSFLAADILQDQALRQVLCESKYEMITANITANIIADLALPMRQMLADGGIILISGILECFREQVEQAISAAGLHIIHQKEQGEWLAYALTQA